MTLCERLGFKVGDTFSYQGHRKDIRGIEFILYEDDGTTYPWFIKTKTVNPPDKDELFIFPLNEIVPVTFVQENE